MKRITNLILLVTLLLNTFRCDQVLEIMDNDSKYTINIQVGTPPVNINATPMFGNNDSFLPGKADWIFDINIKTSDYQFYSKDQQFYDYQRSSTVKLQDFYYSPRLDRNYGPGYSGQFVTDVFGINGQSFIKSFTAVSQIYNAYNDYGGGQIQFNKYTDSPIDLLYQNGKIRTNDYVLQGKYQVVLDEYQFPQEQYNVGMMYDFKPDSVFYNSRANDLLKNPKAFQIKSYGVFLNGVDVTDKLKYRTIDIDQLSKSYSRQVGLPKDIISLITAGIDTNQPIPNCSGCKCDLLTNLPTITLQTAEYIIDITSDMYVSTYTTSYSPDSTQPSTGPCYLNVYPTQDNSYTLLSGLLFQKKYQIMYQKSSNSVRIIGDIKTTKHMTIDSITIVFPIFTALSFIFLILTAALFVVTFKATKSEYIFSKQVKHLKIC